MLDLHQRWYEYELFPVLKEMKRRRGGDLSGGQQQQLAIGRALMSEPQLLILNESTEGIQPSIIQDIGRTLRQLVDEKGMTVLLVEQYCDFARALIEKLATDPVLNNWKDGGNLERLPNDPWDNAYQCLNPGVHGEIDVFSYAADSMQGAKAMMPT